MVPEGQTDQFSGFADSFFESAPAAVVAESASPNIGRPFALNYHAGQPAQVFVNLTQLGVGQMASRFCIC